MSDDHYPCGNSREGYPPGSAGTCDICTSTHAPTAPLPPECSCPDCGHCHISHGKA